MSLLQKISHSILFNLMGWHETVTVPARKKCIICVAPHTTNWDFIIGELYNLSTRKKANFLMKKEWFFWPLGLLLRKLGGFPVYRDKRTSMTDRLAEMIQTEEHFQLAITPEGTRSLSPDWKKGFYFIAFKAQIPIQLYAIDYAKKCIVCTKEIMASGNIEEDMRTIKLYYQHFQGKYPEKFTIGEI